MLVLAIVFGTLLMVLIGLRMTIGAGRSSAKKRPLERRQVVLIVLSYLLVGTSSAIVLAVRPTGWSPLPGTDLALTRLLRSKHETRRLTHAARRPRG
jgi:hypothetical protein